MAVILSHPFICLPNGNPPSSLHLQLFFSLFSSLLSHFSFSFLPCDTELLAVLLIGSCNPNLNNYWRSLILPGRPVPEVPVGLLLSWASPPRCSVSFQPRSQLLQDEFSNHFVSFCLLFSPRQRCKEPHPTHLVPIGFASAEVRPSTVFDASLLLKMSSSEKQLSEVANKIFITWFKPRMEAVGRPGLLFIASRLCWLHFQHEQQVSSRWAGASCGLCSSKNSRKVGVVSSLLASLQAAAVAWIIRCSRHLQPAPISPGPSGGRGRFAALIKHRLSLRRCKLQKKNGMCDEGRKAAQGHPSKRCRFTSPPRFTQ